MKSRKLDLLLAVLVLGTAQPAASAGQETAAANATSVLHRPAASTYYMPPTAIDTLELPQIELGADDPADRPLPYYSIAKDTYLLMGQIAVVDEKNRGWNGNAGFVVTDAGVMVIDALGSPKLGKRVIATIRTVTDKPIRYLVFTHNHPDHYYGVPAFTDIEGITIVGHESTLAYNESATLIDSLDHRHKLMPGDMEGFKRVTPHVLIGGERFKAYRIELGGRHFDVYNVGKHHSYGDLLVHQVEDGIVWASDLVFNNRIAYMGDGDSLQAVQGQHWLIERFSDAKLMVPGHGAAQTPPFPMLTKTLSYMERMRALVGEVLHNDGDLVDAVKKVEVEMPDWKDAHLYEYNHRRNANFTYRRLEEEMLME